MSGTRPVGSASNQRGAALVVVLLLLIVVTLLGLAALRGGLMQERMAMNTYARSMAFQAGETALRQAEAQASGLATTAFDGIAAGACNAAGLCAAPNYFANANSSPAWQASGFWDGTSGYATAASATNGITPKYVIERMGSAPITEQAAVDLLSDSQPPTAFRFFRITVRSKAADGSEVLMQSMYRTP